MQSHDPVAAHLALLDREPLAEAFGHGRIFGHLAARHRRVETRRVEREDPFLPPHQPLDPAHQQAGRRAAQFDRGMGQHGLSPEPPQTAAPVSEVKRSRF